MLVILSSSMAFGNESVITNFHVPVQNPELHTDMILVSLLAQSAAGHVLLMDGWALG